MHGGECKILWFRFRACSRPELGTYVAEAAGEEGEGEVGALVDELQPDAALAPVDVVRRVVGELILRPSPMQQHIRIQFSHEGFFRAGPIQ